jgi:hypothetical protein
VVGEAASLARVVAAPGLLLVPVDDHHRRVDIEYEAALFVVRNELRTEPVVEAPGPTARRCGAPWWRSGMPAIR